MILQTWMSPHGARYHLVKTSNGFQLRRIVRNPDRRGAVVRFSDSKVQLIKSLRDDGWERVS
jgi:hypothetical protein